MTVRVNENIWQGWRILTLFLLAPLCLAQTQPAKLPLADANLLLLEVRLDQHVLSDALTAYQAPGQVLLPLGELARLLTLGIRVQPDHGKASGFILQEERAFYLDAPKATVTVGNRTMAVDPALIKTYPDDIYVASQLLARWLPVDLEIDFAALTLKVRPREPLPLQRRFEREQRSAQAGSPFLAEDPGYPRLDSPYRLWEIPAIDFTLAADLQRADGMTQSSSRYTTFLTGDLLGMESAMFLTGTDRDPAPDFRLTLGRNDPEARLLGPLHARAFAFGSVAVPGVPNITRTSAIGNGLMVSNAPLTQPFSFGRQSFQGDLPPGWDVELFFNDALIGFQQSRSDGRYNFDDVPLVYGTNEFRLVFHGPQGQLRVERQSFLLEQTLLAPGEFYYRAAAHRDQDGHPRSLTQFDWGLGRHLSATAGVATLRLQGEERRYANVGLRAQWGPVFVNSDLVHSAGGSLAELGLRTQLRGLRFGLSHVQLSDDFSSEVFQPSSDPIRARDSLRIDGAIPLHSTLRLPVTFETKRDHFASGLDNLESSLRLSAYLQGISLTNQLRRLSTAGVAITDGVLQVGGRLRRLGLRGQVNYTLSGEKRITAAALTADQSLSRGYFLSAGVTRSLIDPETRYLVGLTKTIGAYGLGIAAGYSTRAGVTLSGQLFLAVAREPRRPRWVFDALPMADSGGVSARVFLDKNLNGVADEGDEPIKGAAFTVNGGRHPVRTDAQGIAYLTRLPVKQNVDLGIDADTLEDPQWSPRIKGARLVPRPGKITALDFPVILTSEIDGSVYLVEQQKEPRGLGGIVLELVDGKGNIVSQTKSATDGYYIVPSVPPGDYLLRVSRGQLNALSLTDTGMRRITVSADGEFVNGVDFIVIPDWESAGTQARQAPVKSAAAPPAEAGTDHQSPPTDRHQRQYTVKKGDGLRKIARLFYGEANTANADKILAVNRAIIRGGALKTGQILRIPPDAPPRRQVKGSD